MLKKTVAVVLVAVLLVITGVPALAAGESMNEKLERVTLIVKETLGIDDNYTQFSGELTEYEGAGYWDLYWSNDTESLTVTADANGKVLRYNCYSDDIYIYDYFYGYAPVLPETSPDDAMPAAQAFLEKVLGAGETASFDPYESGYYTNDVDGYMFTGDVLLSGLKSPISFYVQVNTLDMRVNSFYRSDSYNQYSGDVPSSQAAVSADTAAALLAETVEMRLQYVLEGNGQTAVLQYLPIYNGDYIVDAQTGELIELNALYNDLFKGNYYGREEQTSDAEAVDGGYELSEVEQEAVDGLEGVYSKEELDDAVRAMSELGVGEDYTVQSVSYTVNKETDEVSGQLLYTAAITDEAVLEARFPDTYSEMETSGEINPIYLYKYITVDAFTGKLISLYSYTSGSDDTSVLGAEELEAKAASFMEKYFSETYAQSAVNDGDSSVEDGYIVYSNVVNDIFFPQNSAFISVNTYDGTIDSFSLSWTEDVQFDSASGIVSADTASAAYIACFDTLLQYIEVPVEADGAYAYSYALKLAYRYDAQQSVTGIDAKTGEAIIAGAADESQPLVYDDIQDAYGKNQIEALARYGIGFSGTSFKPTAQLTQKDALILFLSAVGNSSEDEDDLYRLAYNYNFLTEDERDPERLMTRAQLVKMLIGATEYGPAAELEDIYVCGFKDDAQIPSAVYGYVAIAKGLGVVQGDSYNNFNPNNIVTRQDAAIILFNFMSR